MDTKRQRGENFTRQDKELLLERVIERKDIIEMKKYDAASARAKEQAWRDIANNYNVLTSFPRTPSALKVCWENMKRKCRKAYVTEMNAVKSGIKKRCNIESDPLLDRVKDILNLSADNYQNDSIVLYNDGSNSRNLSSGIKEEQSSEFGDRMAITYGYASSNWSDCDPYRLKRPSADVLESSDKRIALYSSKSSPCIQTLDSETEGSDAQDPDETDTFVQDTNNYSPRSTNSKRGNASHSMGEPSKTSPCVQRLTFEMTSDGETACKEDQVLRVNNNRNNVRKQSHRQRRRTNNLSDLLTESKIELVKIAKEQAITEERRRNELHNLQVEETRLKIVEEKKIIAFYELRAQETELKIEMLKSRLENGAFD